MDTTSTKDIAKSWLDGLRRHARTGVLLTLLAITPMMLSCYGRFPLTRFAYRVNGEVGGSMGNDSTQRRFLQSIVMWVFLIIPFYEVSIIADVIVLNVIEFWTGNPIELSEHIAPDGTRFVIHPAADGRTATLTVSRDGKVLTRETLVKISDQRLEVRHENGSLAGTAERTAWGDTIFKDAHGTTISRLPAGEFHPLPIP
jgi:hypothetical protein